MLQVLSAEPLLTNTAAGYADKPDYRPLTSSKTADCVWATASGTWYSAPRMNCRSAPMKPILQNLVK
jgi:hypothetical protein